MKERVECCSAASSVTQAWEGDEPPPFRLVEPAMSKPLPWKLIEVPRMSEDRLLVVETRTGDHLRRVADRLQSHPHNIGRSDFLVEHEGVVVYDARKEAERA